jgi:hypothetical protein
VAGESGSTVTSTHSFEKYLRYNTRVGGFEIALNRSEESNRPYDTRMYSQSRECFVKLSLHTKPAV